MMSNIILIGYMGCGKSTVGKRLSYVLRKPVLDTDRLIEKKEDMTISEIFALYGEEYFRNLETRCLEEVLLQKGEYVIAVGGGLPIRECNRELLKKIGTVLYLRANPDTIYEHLKEDTTRPLLSGENSKEKIKTMMKARTEFYEAAADVTIDVDDMNFEEIIEKVGGLIE